MYLKSSTGRSYTTTRISAWQGYNHNYELADGELYDCENLTSDGYPLLVPRDPRARLIGGHRVTAGKEPLKKEAGTYWLDTAEGKLKQYDGSAWKESTDEYTKDEYGYVVNRNIRGLLLSDNKIAYLDGNVLYYGSESFDFSQWMKTDDEQQLVRFGAYILIFPEGLYANVESGTDYGALYAKYDAPTGVKITYEQSTATGTELQNAAASEKAPESPAAGDYWLCTAAGSEGLNQYNANQKSWSPVTATYIKVTIPGANLKSLFSEGDAVYLNTKYPDINSGSLIVALGTDYFVVSGLMVGAVTAQETTDASWTLTINRKIPDLDYVCISGNRVWGCCRKYEHGNQMLNEIYACKLGDPKNWYVYQGLSTDSWAVSVGVEGDWTGAIEYMGYPYFFKENNIIKVYGSMPSQYQLSILTCRGVQKGSAKSLAVVNEYLVYKSPSDICVFDGSTPVSISKKLGNQMYYDAVGSGCISKYRVVMEKADGTKVFFVYDFKAGLWEKESGLDILFFSGAETGQTYGATKTDIYGFGANDNALFLQKLPGEEKVAWYAQTGDIGLDSMGYKNLSRITLRAYIEAESEVQLWISYNHGPFEELTTMRGNGTLVTYSTPIRTFRCDNYRLKLMGHGPCRIYDMTTRFEEGSDESGEYQH